MRELLVVARVPGKWYSQMAILTFGNIGSQDIALGVNSKRARGLLPIRLHELANSRLVRLDAATSLEDLRMFPSFRLEKLRGSRSGQYSIRINEQYRICFFWFAPDASEVEIVDYH